MMPLQPPGRTAGWVVLCGWRMGVGMEVDGGVVGAPGHALSCYTEYLIHTWASIVLP